MSKLLSIFTICFSFFASALSAGQIVNVDFIHRYIWQKHNINVQVANQSQLYWAANTKYLLCTIDAANGILNGYVSTNYCVSSYATNQAVDTIAAINGIDNLIRESCAHPCDHDDYNNGKVMKCLSGKLSCLWENCEPTMGVGSCGCPSGTKPDGNGGCESVSACTDGQILYMNGKKCSCVSGAWQCNENCPACDGTCGCPAGQIPDGNGNCVTGTKPCTQGDVQYLLQDDNVTIRSKDCPMSGFRDFCPLVDNKIPCGDNVPANYHNNVTGYTTVYDNRTVNGVNYGDAYFEYCCTNKCETNAKAGVMGGTESSYIAMNASQDGNAGSCGGVRIVFIYIDINDNNNLIIRKGECRRPYSTYSCADQCIQKTSDVASLNDKKYENYCWSGHQLGTNSPGAIGLKNMYLSDFPKAQ